MKTSMIDAGSRIVLASCCVLLAWFTSRAVAQETQPAAGQPAAEPGLEKTEPLQSPGMLTLGAAGGEDYFEGRLDALLPLWPVFDGTGLLLGDLRAAFADEGEQEFNAGLAYRHYLDRCHAILGGNLFYDSRWTRDDNHFNQLGAGAEMLSTWLDARVNFYFPDNDKQVVGHAEETVLVGSSRRTTYTDYAKGYEIRETASTVENLRYRTDSYDFYDVPREGWDAEVGVKLPLPASWSDYEARVFLGYYDFEPTWKGNVDSGNDVAGFKARVELRVWNCLFLDAEWYEEDNLYGSDYLLGVRLRLPLGPQAFKSFAQGNAYAWRGGGDGPATVPQRMFDMIMRDPQIQVRNEVELNQTHSSQTKRFTKDYPLLQDVIFVYGDNAADVDENGSAEHPFDVMQEGVDESAARDFPHVYVFGASRPYRENVRIMESLNLLGEGCPVGRGAPPSRGFGRPVVEGQAGPSLLTPAVLEIAGADRVRVRGFEFTAAPYAGGPWTSPFDGGSLAPLAGIYAQDVRDLTVDCNIFRNLVAGIVATYGPVADFDLTVTDNQFRNVGLGIGALTDVGGRAWIGGNDIQDALLGVGFLGLEMTGRAEVDVVGNRITGKTVDLAGIEPFELFSDLFDELLPPTPGFPADHPGVLPFPSLGGIAVVAGPGADIGARIDGNLVRHPAVGIIGLALGLGADPTTLDFAVRDNELVGGGLDSLYQLALAHAGTLAALISGNYGVWDESQLATIGDEIRDALPASLGFDAGLLGVGALAVGHNASMNHTTISGNRVGDYLVGIGALSVAEARMDDARIAGNQMRNNLAGILGLAAVDAHMERVRIADNTLLGAPGLGAVNPLLEMFGLSLLGPDPIQLPEIGLAGIGLIGVEYADLDGFTITGNRVEDYLLGIGAVAVYETDARNGAITGNRLTDNLLGIAGLSLDDGSLDNIEIGGNVLAGGGTIGAVNGLLGGLLDPAGAYDPGISGIALVAVDASANMFSIHDNRLAGQAVGIGVIGVDADMNFGRIVRNQIAGSLAGVLGLGLDSDMVNFEINHNMISGGGIIPLVGLLASDPAALPAGDAGLLGIGLIGIDSDLTDFGVKDNRVRNEALGIVVVGSDTDMPVGLIARNSVEQALVGILGVAESSDMDAIRIEGNTVSGAGMPGLLQLADAVVPGLLPPAIAGLSLPDWGLVGIGLMGVDASAENFQIIDNTVARQAAGILVAGMNGAQMETGMIRGNDVSEHALGIAAIALGADLSGLILLDNTLTGGGLDALNPLLATAPAPLSLHDGGAVGMLLLAAGEGDLGASVVVNNVIDRHAVGFLGVGMGDQAELDGLVVWDNTLSDNAIGILLAGFDGASLDSLLVVQNEISGSVVGLLATASRADSGSTRTLLSLNAVGNTITGSDALLDDGFTALSLVSAMSGNGFYGIPGELLGHDELGNQPSDFLTVLPGLDDILPGGFNPADPPSLEEMVTAPQFGDLLGGQGFAGVMVHLDEADDDSAVYLTSNEIGNMENGIYIVVTDPDDAAVVDLVATDNLSADNVVIGEDTSRADYNLTASGAQQDPFDELPTP